MPVDDECFDAAFILHVGMNIPDKAKLFSEAYRVLRPGTAFGVYDVMLTSMEALTYPVPWSTTPDTSALATREQYVESIEQTGFKITGIRDRRDFAAAFFTETRKRMEEAGGAPALGVHIAMGDSAHVKNHQYGRKYCHGARFADRDHRKPVIRMH